MNRLIKLIGIMLCALTITACAAGGDGFDITVTNFGSEVILDGLVVDDNFRRANTTLPINGGGAHSYFPDNRLRVPEQLTAEWSTPDGRRHHAVIDLNIPGSQYVEEKYGVPVRDQLWRILIAYMDDVVTSGWVVHDEGDTEKPYHFGRRVLYGGDAEVLIRDHMIEPELVDQLPRYPPETGRHEATPNPKDR